VISRPDWSARDSAFALRVDPNARQLKNETEKPRQVTKTRLSKDLGIGRWNKYMEKHLPNTTLAMEKHIESIHDWRCRRIRWAIKETQYNNKPLVPWEVLKKAGIRSQDWAAYFPYLELCEFNQEANRAQ
jgi:hypothetical protein